jgi:hypothetical protein
MKENSSFNINNLSLFILVKIFHDKLHPILFVLNAGENNVLIDIHTPLYCKMCK